MSAWVLKIKKGREREIKEGAWGSVEGYVLAEREFCQTPMIITENTYHAHTCHKSWNIVHYVLYNP